METFTFLGKYLFFPILLFIFLASRYHKKKLARLLLVALLSITSTTINAATGDWCGSAENVSVPSNTSVTLLYEWNAGGGNRGRYYYYQFTAPSNGTVHIYTTGADTDTDSKLFNNNCSSLLTNDYNYDDDIDMTYTVTAGTVYKIDLFNYDRFNYGNFMLHIEFTPAGNTPPVADDQTVTTNIDTAIGITLTGSDADGDPLTYTVTSQPLHGTLSGTAPNLTYTPDTGYNGTDTFKFKVNDGTVDSNEATVTINVTDQTQTKDGFQDFLLINPPATRNVVGNFAMAGNTVMCLTNHTTTYGGTCHGMNDYQEITSNLHISKYIDIDNDSRTWNSTSSYIELPDTYKEEGDGKGVLWAGLFWQGRFSTDRDYPMHYGMEDGNSYDLIEMGKGSNNYYEGQNIDVISLDANKLKLKVTTPSGSGNYEDVKAKELTTYRSSNGVTYAAYADVTDIVQAAHLEKGKNTFTVANLTTNEGREGSPGIFGGWSLLVIYGENSDGKLRNISVYHGFQELENKDNAQPIKISGFRLPKEGTVNSTATVFSGEGEYLYGYPFKNRYGDLSYDWMKISNQENSAYQYLPGPDGTPLPNNGSVGNRNNMFDAVLTGIKRDHVNGQSNDLQINNDGIDVDVFDVSSIMESYRDDNPTINTIYLKAASNNDYVTPSMIAFATELYQPNVCYDFVAKLNEFVIPYKDRTSYKAYAKQGDELSFTVAIWDIKGDIDPQYVSIGLPVTQYQGYATPIMNPDKAYYTIPNGNTLLPTDYARPMSTTKRPVITIGEGRTANVGGTITQGQRYFTKFYFKVEDTNASLIEGDYDVEVNATLNYGSGDFWQIMGLKRCDQNLTYSPTWVQFNVEQAFGNTPPSNPTAHYSLPTRVAGRDFNYDVASYGKDSNDQYTQPISADGVTVDVEMIDIGDFDDNGSYFKCGNSDPNIIMMPGKFSYFDNGDARITVNDINDLSNTSATRNATFRMWLLTDENGTLLTSDRLYEKNENDHYAQIYDNYYRTQDVTHLCTRACSASDGYDYTSTRYTNIHYGTDPNAVGCYACLRDKFAQPYCARDNFAIRPKAIRVDVGDKGVDKTLSSIPIATNIDRSLEPNKDISIAAEYPYELNMTTVNINDNTVNGYTTIDLYEKLTGFSSIPDRRFSSMALIKFEGDASKCADATHSSLNPQFASGFVSTDLNTTNAGAYSFEIWDSNWTTVDRAANNPYKTLFDTACKNNSDAACNDCILGTTTVDANDADKIGCTFGSELQDPVGSPDKQYTKLNLLINPYRFGLSISLIDQPSGGTAPWVYMNDLTQNALGSRNPGASAQLNGEVSALGASNGKLSNYTDGCAAQGNVFWLDRNMSTAENLIATEQNLNSVYFQQWLDSDSPETQPVQDNSSGLDMNATLVKANYYSEQNGTANVILNYNFKKPYNDVVNPVIVGFETLHTVSPDATSYANHKSNYVPEGNVTVDENRTFFFAKVDTAIGTDGQDIYTPDTTYTTSVRVDVYCRDDATAGIVCANIPDFNTTNVPPETAEESYLGGGWFRMGSHSATDGLVLSITSDVAGVIITPNTNIAMDTNGSSGAITIKYPLDKTRPAHPIFTITPDEWLKFSTDPTAAGLPKFQLNFLSKGLKWKGTGKTGNVIETEPTIKQNRRLNW